jgi:hypothetical protein
MIAPFPSFGAARTIGAPQVRRLQLAANVPMRIFVLEVQSPARGHAGK